MKSTYYVSYKESHVHNYKGIQKKRTQTRVKQIPISGHLSTWSRGNFVTRFGSKIHGIKFIYINPIPQGTGRDRRIKKMRITKIISIPETATNVKVSRTKPKS